MAAVSTFNTGEVRPWDQPQAQNEKVINLPQTYIAPPRLSVGLTQLDIKAGTNVRVKAFVDQVDNRKYTGHLEAWGDTTLYAAAFDALVLKPANLDILSGEFSTQEDHPWDKPQPETKRRINFERPFITPPKVLCYLREVDAGNGASTRVKTYPTDIDNKGFTIHIDSWSDTKLYTGVASWIAYPEDKDYIASGIASTSDIRTWDKPQADNKKAVNFSFGGSQFIKNPTVFVALNMIDIASSNNLRVKTYVDNVSPQGLTWHIDSWGDTKLYGASVSYIALN